MHDLLDTARQQLGWYVRNCAFSPAVRMLECIMLERLNFLKGHPDRDKNDLDLTAATQRRRLMRELHHVLRSYSCPGESSESLEQNARFARDEFELDAIDTEILLLLLRYQRNKELESFVDEVVRRLESVSRSVSALIGADTREVHRRIVPESALLRSGVLITDDDCAGFGRRSGFLQISPPLRKIMFRPYNSREEWAASSRSAGVAISSPSSRSAIR
jgi:hypothetical protein